MKKLYKLIPYLLVLFFLPACNGCFGAIRTENSGGHELYQRLSCQQITDKSKCLDNPHEKCFWTKDSRCLTTAKAVKSSTSISELYKIAQRDVLVRGLVEKKESSLIHQLSSLADLRAIKDQIQDITLRFKVRHILDNWQEVNGEAVVKDNAIKLENHIKDILKDAQGFSFLNTKPLEDLSNKYTAIAKAKSVLELSKIASKAEDITAQVGQDFLQREWSLKNIKLRELEAPSTSSLLASAIKAAEDKYKNKTDQLLASGDLEALDELYCEVSSNEFLNPDKITLLKKHIDLRRQQYVKSIENDFRNALKRPATFNLDPKSLRLLQQEPTDLTKKEKAKLAKVVIDFLYADDKSSFEQALNDSSNEFMQAAANKLLPRLEKEEENLLKTGSLQTPSHFTYIKNLEAKIKQARNQIENTKDSKILKAIDTLGSQFLSIAKNQKLQNLQTILEKELSSKISTLVNSYKKGQQPTLDDWNKLKILANEASSDFKTQLPEQEMAQLLSAVPDSLPDEGQKTVLKGFIEHSNNKVWAENLSKTAKLFGKDYVANKLKNLSVEKFKAVADYVVNTISSKEIAVEDSLRYLEAIKDIVSSCDGRFQERMVNAFMERSIDRPENERKKLLTSLLKKAHKWTGYLLLYKVADIFLPDLLKKDLSDNKELITSLSLNNQIVHALFMSLIKNPLYKNEPHEKKAQIMESILRESNLRESIDNPEGEYLPEGGNILTKLIKNLEEHKEYLGVVEVLLERGIRVSSLIKLNLSEGLKELATKYAQKINQLSADNIAKDPPELTAFKNVLVKYQETLESLFDKILTVENESFKVEPALKEAIKQVIAKLPKKEFSFSSKNPNANKLATKDYFNTKRDELEALRDVAGSEEAKKQVEQKQELLQEFINTLDM